MYTCIQVGIYNNDANNLSRSSGDAELGLPPELFFEVVYDTFVNVPRYFVNVQLLFQNVLLTNY